MVNNYVVIISSRWTKMRLVFELYSRLLRANLSHVDRQSVVLSHWGILGSELTATTSSRSTTSELSNQIRAVLGCHCIQVAYQQNSMVMRNPS